MKLDIYNDIIEYIAEVIKDTEWEGHVYAVGGCCRDVVMGNCPNDIDLAVTLPRGGVKFALWLNDAGLLSEKPVMFFKYDTSMFAFSKYPDYRIECVQTRKLKYSGDNYHHTERAFGSLKQDAHLRDLTINTLYFDISKGKMIDGSGYALNDIKHKIIRTPGSPETIFHDDPVRVLRVIRFAAQLGWKINNHTYSAMKKYVKRLKDVKYPRLHNELVKIESLPDSRSAKEMIARLNIPQVINKEEYETKYHINSD